MKLNKLFPLFIAVLALMTSCADEATVTLLDEVQVSSSYVSIPVEGGSTTITVNAKDSWTAKKVFIMLNDSVVKDSISWLKISTTSGAAGETELTFSATSTLNGRTAEVLIQSAGKTQRLNVIQGLSKAAEATAVEVNAGPDGKTYRIKGTCTKIENTLYGNWYLTDNTGSVYIYGTLDEKGSTKNFSSLEIGLGDEVTVEGPRSNYKGAPQLVNVTVISISKSLIKVDSVINSNLEAVGGEFTAILKCIGQGISVDIPEDANSWLSISSIQQNGIDAVVKFKAAANTGGDRNTTIKFLTSDGTKESSTSTNLTQKGVIIEASIADFITAANKTTQYRLKAVVSRISDAAKGRFYIKDFSGEVYVYNMAGFQNSGVKVGDIVTLVGKYDVYNGTHELVSAVLESSISVTTTTIADVLTKENNPNVFYMVTGEIKEIQQATYGNLILKDGDNEILVYGCYPGYGATGEFRKNLIADKGLKVGDTLTVIAPKILYGTKIELSPSFYFNHVSAE